MRARTKDQNPFPPGGKVLNKPIIGSERGKALKKLKEISKRAGTITREMGLASDEDVARFINESR